MWTEHIPRKCRQPSIQVQGGLTAKATILFGLVVSEWGRLLHALPRNGRVGNVGTTSGLDAFQKINTRILPLSEIEQRLLSCQAPYPGPK
jgi:hypothetical protein